MAPGMSKRLVQNLDNLYQQLMRQVEAGTMTISEAIEVMEEYFGQYLRDLDTPGEGAGGIPGPFDDLPGGGPNNPPSPPTGGGPGVPIGPR